MGIDDRDVVTGHEMKSIGHEDTFSEDIRDIGEATKQLLFLSNKVARRMRRKGLKGKTVTLKVKYSNFVQITRSTTLRAVTDDGLTIYSTVCPLLEKTEVGRRPVRLLGVSMSHLTGLGVERQLTLFGQGSNSAKRKELNKTLDSLHDRFGERSVRPGTLIERKM
jgi:DNA polymerase-4